MIETKLDGRTADILEENIEKLREIFPDVFEEGKIDFEKLQQVLGEYVDDSKERYNFSWNGKGKALKLAQSPSTGTLRPCKEESKNWDTTENLYIEGDNLEVLKLLQKSYHGKIKMIYIDPPYNTGKDFVYPDDYRDNMQNYLELTGQVDGEGRKLGTNPDTNGRYHTDWLNMMYPRLRLARNLLADDGAIMIHIDEHEVNNVQKLCNEIFGENNELGTIIWDKRNPKGVVAGVAYQHESIIVFCKNITTFADTPFLKKKENADAMLAKVNALIRKYGTVNEQVRQEYKDWIRKNKDVLSGGESAYSLVDEQGNIYQPVSMAAPDKPETRSHRPLLHPITNKPCPVPEKGWRFTDGKMDELVLLDKIEFGTDETTQPRQKYFLKDNLEEAVASLLYYGGSDDAMGLPFENPKPVYVAQRLVYSVCKNNDDIILDFFSGSATTAHAVMQLNAEDDGKRKFICVQLPEPTDEKSEAYKAGYKNICEIGKERIRRAGDKINSAITESNAQITIEGEEKKPVDIGFKVFKLDTSNIKKWDPDFEETTDLESYIAASEDSLVSGRSELDLVYEIMLKYGLDLTYPVEELSCGDKKIYSIGFGMLIICVCDNATTDIADFIANYKKQNNIEEMRVVFKDSSFNGNDSAKTNVKEILKSAGVEEFITI